MIFLFNVVFNFNLEISIQKKYTRYRPWLNSYQCTANMSMVQLVLPINLLI